jgi:predicted acylesterase/phospholipase RssA
MVVGLAAVTVALGLWRWDIVESLVNRLDRLLRRWDWQTECNYPPPDVARRRWYRFFHVRGNSPRISLLTILIVIVCVYGPMGGWRGPGAVALVAASAALLLVAVRLVRTSPGFFSNLGERGLMPWQIAVVFALAAIVWLLGADHRESDDAIYRHAFIPAFVLLTFTLLVGALLADWLFRRDAGVFARHLRNVELFFSPRDNYVPISRSAFARSLATTPLYHPLQLLLPAALVGVLVADRELMQIGMAMMLGFFWFVIAAAAVHKRLSAATTIYREMFLVGGQLFVSIAVIALAGARLFQEPYITTLVESGPGSLNERIIFYIVAAYVFLWFHEYWLNRLLAEKVLALFRGRGDRTAGARIKYPVRPQVVDTKVVSKGRYLQTHSGGRFAVVGVAVTPDYRGPAWNFYRREELIDAVMNRTTLLAQLPKRAALKALQQADKIKQKLRFYFAVLDVLLVLTVLAIGWHFFQLPAKAAVSAHQPSAQVAHTQLVDLQARLFDPTRDKERAILLAASGGGTRAALYAESVLRGLREVEALDDVVLLSTVSGGSAAAAYFAAYRDALLAGDPESPAWNTFSSKMAEPFIQDVLEGASEWRLLAGELQPQPPRHVGVRLGELLAESFERRFFDRSVPTLGSQRNVALIFNTTLTGEFPRWPAERLDAGSPWRTGRCAPDQPLVQRETECRELRSSLSAGGRLIFTNLHTDAGFPRAALPDAPKEHLTYVVVRDPDVPLARAAAASANFPPVFSNIPIDVDGRERHWVTDGGASDNRGIESLLYALIGALKQEQAWVKDNGEGAPRARPHLVVVVAEASAVSSQFVQDRGVGAKFGAPAKFASQLMLHLINDARWRYRSLGGTLSVHYLPMPLVLRADGGIGTHWKLQASLKFDEPMLRRIVGREQEAVTFEGEQIRGVIDSLHSLTAPLPVQAAREHEKLWEWICADVETEHQKLWQCLADRLGEARRDYAARCSRVATPVTGEIGCPREPANLIQNGPPTR